MEADSGDYFFGGCGSLKVGLTKSNATNAVSDGKWRLGPTVPSDAWQWERLVAHLGNIEMASGEEAWEERGNKGQDPIWNGWCKSVSGHLARAINRSLSKCSLGGAISPCRFTSIVFSSPLALKFQSSQESSCPICGRSDLNWHNYALRRLRRGRDSAAPSHFNGYAQFASPFHLTRGFFNVIFLFCVHPAVIKPSKNAVDLFSFRQHFPILRTCGMIANCRQLHRFGRSRSEGKSRELLLCRKCLICVQIPTAP
jgi:hypothetical protein